MSADEQRDRMRLMRGIVREFNVYRWAGRMLIDAAVMRQRSRYGATDVAVGRI
jgi:trehalose 6-phosphate synthase